jgi:hypothetical protein
MEKTYLKKRKGIEPEEFIFVTKDMSSGLIKNMSGKMSEAEVRAFLISGGGGTEHEIDAAIDAVRQEAEDDPVL